AELGQRILDLGDRQLRPEHPDLAGLGVDQDLDVLVAFGPPVGRLDGVLDRPDELVAGDLLLLVELQQRGDEVTIHWSPPVTTAAGRIPAVPRPRPAQNKTWGSPTSWSGRSVVRSIHPGGWTLTRGR